MEEDSATVGFKDTERTAWEGTCSEFFGTNVNPIYLPQKDRALRAICSLLRDDPDVSEDDQELMIVVAKKLPNVGVLNPSILTEALKYFFIFSSQNSRKRTPTEFKAYCRQLEIKDGGKRAMTNEEKVDFLRYIVYVEKALSK